MSGEHNNKLNETEIICPSELSLDEKNTYNDSILKSLKESQYSLTNKSNILLNSLKDFSNRYDIDDRKIIKSKKFLISFNELISLIKFALEFQIKINNSLNEYLNEISQDFINNLSYYIFSFEKIDINKQNEYQTINCNNNKYKESWHSNNKKNKFEQKKENKEEKQNINKNKMMKLNNTHKNINVNRNEILNIKSPINQRKSQKNNYEKNDIRFHNKSVEKRCKSNNYFTLDYSKNDDNQKKSINKSTENRRSLKTKEKENEKDLTKKRYTKSFSIFTVCENLKNSSFIMKSTKSRRESCVDQNKTNIKRNTYYNQCQNLAIKKQILSNNIIRPSSFANKLLQKGIKYINDFANMKEEAKKKNY